MEQKMIDEIVKKAYERYRQEHNSEIDTLALKALNTFHNRIDSWQGSPEILNGMGFYKKFLTGKHMDAIASRGASTARVDVFKNIMNKVGTVRKIAQLFCLRRDDLNNVLPSQISEVDLFEYVTEHPFLEGNRPVLYTNRFIISIFTEIMTTIADMRHLKDTAEILGIETDQATFEDLQIKIRKKIEASLIRQNLGTDLSKFTRAGIAYQIKDVVA